MYTNALVKRAGIFAGLGEVEKCQTCFTKALAIDSNCADVFIYRARVSFNGSMYDCTYSSYHQPIVCRVWMNNVT